MSVLFISQNVLDEKDNVSLYAKENNYEYLEFRINNLCIKIADDRILLENPLYEVNKDNSGYAFIMGEFYNTEAIINDLKRKGHYFKNNFDAELIIHIYEEYGEQYFKHLNGKFVIFIVDIVREKAFLLNDRYGFYNFYYAYVDDKLLLCNNQQFLTDYIEEKNLNIDSVHEFFNFGYILGDKTLLKELNRIEPATFMQITYNSVTTNTYWNWNKIERKKNEYSYDKAVEKVGELWINAVDRVMSKHKNYYLPLSGGLDSRAILAAIDYLNLNYKLNLTYTFGKKNCLDNQIASRAANIAGVKHEFIELIGDYWWKNINSISLNKFLMGMINCIYCHGIASKEVGLKHVYLNGFLGDFVLGGSYLDERFINCSQGELSNLLRLKMRHSGINNTRLLNNFYETGINFNNSDINYETTDFFYISQGLARNLINNGTSVLGDKFYHNFPFFDNDLIDFIYSLPNEWRMNAKIYKSMLLKFFPKFFKRVPWQKTKLPIDFAGRSNKANIRVGHLKKKFSVYRIRKNTPKIVIFGASKKGRSDYNRLRLKYNVRYFCDNNPELWGNMIKGIEIISPNDLTHLADVKVFVSSMYYQEIVQQLLDMGVKRYAIINPYYDYDDSYIDYDNWMRDENIKSDIYNILLSDKCKDRGYYNIDEVKVLLDNHMNRSVNASKDIGLLLTFEMFCRTYLDMS